MLEIIQIPVLNDNYIYLLHEPILYKTAVVDPAVSQPVIEILQQKNWSLDFILNTHHHSDHTDANIALKKLTHCQILGSETDKQRIPAIDKTLQQDDQFQLGNETIKVIETTGHTIGHIVFYCQHSQLLFCGDTLFSMGCGRLFEGSAEQLWYSLQKLKTLPMATQIYCSHEYTQVNGQFALSVEPNNSALQQRIKQVNTLRLANKPTIPSTLEQELATNPFLREQQLEIQQHTNTEGKSPIDVFTQLRHLKDSF